MGPSLVEVQVGGSHSWGGVGDVGLLVSDADSFQVWGRGEV